jgi:hypothetical protein
MEKSDPNQAEEPKIKENLDAGDANDVPKTKKKKKDKYFNKRIVFENACLDRGEEYYDYENFDIPWE